MKSLKERLAEKAKRDERKRLERSVQRLSYISIKVPRLSRYVEGDAIYIEARVKKIIEHIKMRSSWEVFTEFRKQIGEINKEIEAGEAADAERMRQWEVAPEVQTPVDPTPMPREPRRPRRGRPPIRGRARRAGRGGLPRNFFQLLDNIRLPDVLPVTPAGAVTVHRGIEQLNVPLNPMT